MEPILSLSPQQFRAALAELQLDPAREAMLVEQYNAANAPQPGGRDRGMLRNLLDNIIGFDDEVVTPGERLGAGVQELAGGLLSDPLGTGAGILQGGYETIERAMAPGATPMDVMGAAGMAMGAGGLLTRPAGSVGMGGRMLSADDVLDLADDDFVTLYHGTTREGADAIRNTGRLRSAGEPSVYLTTDPSGGGYGDGTVVPVRVRRGLLQIDDEFPDGRADFRIDLNRPGGSVSVQIPETPAQQVARLLREGRADEVTDDLMAQADPQEMFRLYEAGETGADMPMDFESRMARAAEMFPDTAYHSTGVDFQAFIPSEFRGASFFGSTPEGASRGASASANEGVGSGSTVTMPVRVNTRNVEGLGAYGRRDMNEFAASLPDRFYTEAEVDALMASEVAPRYGDWSYFFNDLTDYEALRNFRDANPSAEIPEGMIQFRPKQPLSYAPGLRSDISGRQFAHYSEGMSERPISEHAREIGNTGFTMMDESGLALAMTDPTQVRSRFARFDPRLSHLANLNAANVDPLTGAAAVSASQQDDPLANLRAYIAAAGGVLPR